MVQLSRTDLEKLIQLAEDAGKIILSSDRAATQKIDGTDVTMADMASHKFLVSGIQNILGKDTKILSEESDQRPTDFNGLSVIIDPLDGTTNFKNNGRHFAVLLSLMKDGVPIYGVAVLPAYGVTVCGGILTNDAELRLHNPEEISFQRYKQKRTLPTKSNQHKKVALVPRRFIKSTNPHERSIMDAAMTAFQKHAQNTSFQASHHILGSIMPILKKNVKYRIYQAVRPNQRPGDWDLAAWDGILRGVGGMMTDMNGHPIPYGNAKNDFKHDGFICWRDKKDVMAYRQSLVSSKNNKPPENKIN